MSKADELFKELGYKIKYSINNNELIIIGYYKEDNEISIEQCSILFLKKAKMIIFNKIIDMQELKAINEKCKELGWLDE